MTARHATVGAPATVTGVRTVEPLAAAGPETKSRVDLVLEGGGVKGIAFVGALKELCAGHTVRRVAGTSAGAVVGALLAAGYTVPELEDTLRGMQFASFEDGWARHFGKPGAALAFLLRNGVFKGDTLHAWIEERLARKNVVTFKDLRHEEPGDDPGTPPYRLVVTVSDISRGRELHLPWDCEELCGVDPDSMKVADAVRASASIPFFFRPFPLKCGPGQGSERLVLVDGGMLSNFPVALFDRRDGRPPRWPTWGLKLSMRTTPAQDWRPAGNPVTLIERLVSTMTDAHDRLHIDERSVQERTVFIDTDRVRSTDFRLTREQSDYLLAQGQDAAGKFLSSWDFNRWLDRWSRQPDAAG